MSVHNFLDLSTGHLPVTDRLRLDQLASRDLPFRVFGHKYGWNIWLSGEGKQFDMNIEALEEVYGFTSALGYVLRHAKHHECWMVNFDRDAERIEGLAYWDEKGVIIKILPGDAVKQPQKNYKVVCYMRIDSEDAECEPLTLAEAYAEADQAELIHAENKYVVELIDETK